MSGSKLSAVVPFGAASEATSVDSLLHDIEHKLFPTVTITSICRYTFKKWSTWASLVVLFASVAVGTWRAMLSESTEHMTERQSFTTDCNEVADNLRRQVQTSVSSLYALAAMSEVDGGVWLEHHFEKVASVILTKYPGISNFDIAPYAVVKTKVPLKGNEGAIGHSMLSDYRRITATLKTIRDNKVQVDGPLKLLQGGTAVIARFPVFTIFSPQSIPDVRSWWATWPDVKHSCCNTTQTLPLPGFNASSLPGPIRNGTQTYFYGLIEFVSMIDKMTESLSLDQVQLKMSYQFRNKNPHSSMTTPVFANSPDCPPGCKLENPVVVPISDPELLVDWEFVAVPKGGWKGASSLYIVAMVSVYCGFCASFLTFMFMESKSLQIHSAKRNLVSRSKQVRDAFLGSGSQSVSIKHELA